MIGTVILVGLNYLFTRLFDQVYGKLDLGLFIATGVLFIALAGSFTYYLWLVDARGTFARMLGARDEDSHEAQPRRRTGRASSVN